MLLALVEQKVHSNEAFIKLKQDIKAAKTEETKKERIKNIYKSDKKISPLTVLCNKPSK